MARRNGVLKYVKATLDIYFPDGEVYCWSCPLLHRGRQMCMRSGEIIENVRGVGNYCELKFEEVNDESIPITETV